MKHCRSCENCYLDPLNAYIKGIDCYVCSVDGHLIERPFWHKCVKYSKDSKKKRDKRGSLLYQIIEKCKRGL